MTTDPIVAFLTARLDELAAAAEAAEEVDPSPWTTRESRPICVDVVNGNGDYVADADHGNGPLTPESARHIARHDPRRVLADVEAKRRIVALVKSAHGGYADAAWEAVYALASAYADHPDFDPPRAS